MPATHAGPSLIVIETAATLLIVAAAWLCPRLGSGVFLRAEQMLGRLARRRTLAVLIVTASALFGRLLLLPLIPIPEPYVHDEFSYLLAGDTFASGRLTNPTHALWVSFESFHINQKPTYMSMYFPAQGLALAAGQKLFGHPWYGVWLTAGLMCGTICWMLQQWLPPGWAFFGGMLAVVRLGMFSYWVDSYKGGALAAIGGALVLGALPLIRRRHGHLHGAILMGLGAALLANTRPYEGLLLCAPVAVATLVWLYRQKSQAKLALIRRVILPLALILAATAAAMAYYNWRVFGNPATLPYKLNRTTYAVANVFFWQKPNPEPAYRHKILKDFYVSVELPDALEARTPLGFLKRTAEKAGIAGFFLFGMVLIVPLPAMLRAIRSRRTRLLTVCAALSLFGLMLNVWLFPHYLAPAVCLIYALLMQAMRYLRQWRPSGQPAGLFLVRAVAVMCLALCGVRAFAGPLHITVDRWPSMWHGTAPLGLARAGVVRQLSALPGRHLAIVHYSPGHNPVDDWVYNAADIDGSRIVWAREMDAAQTRRLIQYFAGRRVWLVEPDCVPPRVWPYTATRP
ncbi:MAG TPA: hypothetical protein VLW25_01825 [Bryobacteraceae bacterium]|nr:hypothetical protein [Bryobacteraceae bacterium]